MISRHAVELLLKIFNVVSILVLLLKVRDLQILVHVALEIGLNRLPVFLGDGQKHVLFDTFRLQLYFTLGLFHFLRCFQCKKKQVILNQTLTLLIPFRTLGNQITL